MEEDFIENFHSYHDNSLSYKHYPPAPASEFHSHKKERLGAHSDGGSMTLLFQDDCGGLEVERPGKRGEFLPVDPIDGTLVFNIGDVLMRWSNGTPPPFLIAHEIFELRCGFLTFYQILYYRQFIGCNHPHLRTTLPTQSG